MKKKVNFALIVFLCGIIFGCKPEVNPCNCAKNLLKEKQEFNKELDEACDAYLESLDDKSAEKWTDSMMNCVSETK